MTRGRPSNVSKDAIRTAGRAENDPKRKSRIRYDDESEDRLYVPPHLIPEGFTVEYKRHSILLQPEKVSNIIHLQQQHWQYVSIKAMPQFAELMPMGYSGDTIERDGVILMIRETYLCEEAHQDDYDKAREQVDQKTKQLGGAGANEFKRNDPIIRKTYERDTIPVDADE